MIPRLLTILAVIDLCSKAFLLIGKHYCRVWNHPLTPSFTGRGIIKSEGDTTSLTPSEGWQLLRQAQDRLSELPLKILVRAAMIFSLFLFVACAKNDQQPTPTSTPRPVTATVRFMAGFRPQANLPFVAVYVAKEKGFFAEQGLNVEISHAFQGEHLRLLLANEIDVTTANADSVIRNRAAAQAPIKAIALIGQRSEQAYAVLKDSEINSPKDFEGKTVGYRIAATPDYLAMLKLTGTDRSKIKEVPVTFDPRLLTEKKVDVYPVFLANEPYTLKQIGFDVRTFAGADYGVPTLGLTYIVKESDLPSKQEIYQRFLKAALYGLYYARDHIDEAVDMTLIYAKDANREQQKYLMISEMSRAVTPDTLSNGLGWMTERQWKDLHDSLLQFNAIASQVPKDLLYDDSLLKSIYKDGKLIWP